MNTRHRKSLLKSLPALTAMIAVLLTPLMEANAQRSWRLFPRLTEARSSATTMTCDPTTGVCTYNAPVSRPRILNRTPYIGYGTTTTSNGSSGGVLQSNGSSGGTLQSNGSSGGSGAYGTVYVNPGERIVSITPAVNAAIVTKTATALTSLEDGSLLSQIMDKLADDPEWTPGPTDNPLLVAAFEFLQSYSAKASTGAFQSTSLDPAPSSATVNKPNGSLRGKVSWTGPSIQPKVSLAKLKLSWSPPVLIASR